MCSQRFSAHTNKSDMLVANSGLGLVQCTIVLVLCVGISILTRACALAS
jgi:hypothetical protein